MIEVEGKRRPNSSRLCLIGTVASIESTAASVSTVGEKDTTGVWTEGLTEGTRNEGLKVVGTAVELIGKCVGEADKDDGANVGIIE